MSVDVMPKDQAEFIEATVAYCLESLNVSEEFAEKFAHCCWVLGYRREIEND